MSSRVSTYFGDVVATDADRKIRYLSEIRSDRRRSVRVEHRSFELFVFEPSIDMQLLDNRSQDVEFESPTNND